MKLPVVTFPVLIPECIGLNKTEFNRPKYLLQKDFIAIVNGHKHIIPAGIEFDYASIPRPFWSVFLPYSPLYAGPSLLHDTCYQGMLWSRGLCDRLFLAGMISNGVDALTRNTMYAAVRAGGWINYKKRNLPKMPIVRGLMGIGQFTAVPLWDEV